MVVMILERAPTGVRGLLSRWMIEPHPGVFVGNLNQTVRIRAWNLARQKVLPKGGAGVLIYTARNEQGFNVEQFGDDDRRPVDMEGLWLIQRTLRTRKTTEDTED